MPFSVSITMLCATTFKSIDENGKDIATPIIAPTTEIARYFTRYSERIFPFVIPIAFMIPICLNSSLSVNPIVNLRTTIAIRIRAILTTSRIPAIIISMIYVKRKIRRLPLNAIASHEEIVFFGAL